MEDQGRSHRQARVRLTTKSSDIQLPPNMGAILVSTEFKRYQLSSLVNKLLETPKPIPLEFLVNGQYLRTSLDEFLTLNGISAETTLDIEYVRALIPPSTVAAYEHEVEITSVDVLSSTSPAGRSSKDLTDPSSHRILSSTFDGSLHLWNMSSEKIATGKFNNSIIKSAKFMNSRQIVSSSNDRSVRVWDANNLQLKLELWGHMSCVNRLAVHPRSSRLLTGSDDHTIGIWTTIKAEAPEPPEGSVRSDHIKRIRSEGKSIPRRGPLKMLEGHTQRVYDVCFDEKDATVAYSASWDKSAKTWDLTTGQCVSTRVTPNMLMCVCHLPAVSLLATGPFADDIFLIDTRASAATVSAMTLRGHKNTIGGLARDPESDYRLVSGSYDGTCRIWDIRSVRVEAGTDRISSSVCVFDHGQKRRDEEIPGQFRQVFGVCWDKDAGIVSGGGDSKVQIHKFGQ